MTEREHIEEAFRSARKELGIRRGFPPEVQRGAAEAAKREGSAATHADLTEVPFVTVDPPGSRDLDQALHIQRADGGYRVRYAIADVGYFVDRGGALEREAWLRGVTYYSPDHREPLYPEVLSQEAASLLPHQTRPSIVFDIALDGRGELVSMSVARARVRSRAQLTYQQVAQHVTGGESLFAGEPWAEVLPLLREVGELRLERERERGGVSLPIRDQHVQQKAALQLGYALVYEEPNAAEEWNAQISLLTGHAAALRMLEAEVGLLRTLAPPKADDLASFRVAAEALGFAWPAGMEYPEFIHSLDPSRPHIEALVWQARRLMRGADYIAFRGDSPSHIVHSALAFSYSHCTAPLRRLADRYVLDLLVQLQSGERPTDAEVATLTELPAAMEEAARKSGRLEKRVVSIAEAWVLLDRVGDSFPGVVLDVRGEHLEVQLPEPPIRARIERKGADAAVRLGEAVELRLAGVEVGEGRVELELLSSAPPA